MSGGPELSFRSTYDRYLGFSEDRRPLTGVRTAGDWRDVSMGNVALTPALFCSNKPHKYRKRRKKKKREEKRKVFALFTIKRKI